MVIEWVAMGVCVILIVRRAHNLLFRNEAYRLITLEEWELRG